MEASHQAHRVSICNYGTQSKPADRAAHLPSNDLSCLDIIMTVYCSTDRFELTIRQADGAAHLPSNDLSCLDIIMTVYCSTDRFELTIRQADRTRAAAITLMIYM